jgi:hypothetical protein
MRRTIGSASDVEVVSEAYDGAVGVEELWLKA